MNGPAGVSGWIVVVIALLLATTAVAGAEPLDAPNAPEEVRDGTPLSIDRAPDALAQADPPGNNSTISHRNPSEVADESELGGVEEWLAREVSGDSGGIDLSDEDRERARELVNDDPELAELAARYADDSGDEGQQFDQSGVLGAVQRKFFADVQRYRETYREYSNATERNSTERERRLAHELERRAAAVNQSARQLNRSYAELESGERADLDNVTRTIGEVRANVTASQRTVRDRTLVRTQLSVRATDSSGSFADPVTLAGRLRTADGSPLADERVTLLVGGQVRNATTDAEGRFEVAYRPTVAAAGNRSRTIWFRPANDSAYLRASDTARFAVERVRPNLTVTNRTEAVSYGELFAVDGIVRAGGEGVSDVPVAVTLDGVPVGTVRTGPNGSFGAAARLPGNVSAGDREVRVRLALDAANSTAGTPDRIGRAPNRTDGSPDGPSALAPANASARVTVESTPTALSIIEVEPLERSAFVAGRLLTDEGAPLANQTVALRVDGTPVGTAVTDDNGAFAATVRLPSNESGGSSVRVVAEFPSPGNLESARSNATVALSSSENGLPVDPLELGVAGLLGVTALGVAVWRFRSADALPFGSQGRDGPEVGERGANARTRHSADAFLDAATAALEDESHDAAVGAAYASVRRRLADDREYGRQSTGARTHWEFYADCRTAGLSDDRLDQLERLTEAYECAAFAPDPVSSGEAETAVGIARAFGDESGEVSAV